MVNKSFQVQNKWQSIQMSCDSTVWLLTDEVSLNTMVRAV